MIGRRLLMGGGGSVSVPVRAALAPTGAAFDVASGGAYKAFPGLCVMPNGNLLCVYRSGVTHITVDGVILGRISTDGGETWGGASTIHNPATDARDPSVTTLSDGRIALSYFEWDGAVSTGVFVKFSSDNAISWGSPVTMTSTFSIEVACSAPIIEFTSSLYIQPIYGRSGTDWDAACLFSTDGGATWGGQITIASGSGRDWTEPWIVRTFSGSLLCLIRVDDISEIYSTTSANAGTTWTAPISLFAGKSRASTICINTGVLFTLYRKSSADPDGLYRSSLDDGVTWNAAVLWTSSPFEYAAFAQFSSGRIVGVWAQEASATDADVYLSVIA